MGETRTYIVPEGGSSFGGNNDLATMALLSNNNGGMFGGNGMWNNPFMYFVWLYMMRWMNGNGWGNDQDSAVQRQIQTLQEQMQDNHNSDLLMQAIKGNNDAISEFATRTGCSINAVQSAIQGVSSSINQVASQLGFSSERIINAVNQGDCGVIQALKDCCCETQKSILSMGYDNQLANQRQTYEITGSINSLGNQVATGFTTTQFLNQAQTCNLQNTIRDVGQTNTALIVAKLDAILNQALLDKIEALRSKNEELAAAISNYQQTAQFAQMINAATAPIASTLGGLVKDVDGIKCQLPSTVTTQYSPFVAVPNCLAAQIGLYNGGLYGSTGSIWG